MKFVITGAAGMLGTAVREKWQRSDWELIATDKNANGDNILHLDVEDHIAVDSLLAEYRPDIVLHLAAETDVDLCEKDPDHAYRANAWGTENIAWACRKIGCGLVYISTGSVFGGDSKKPYNEFDNPNPVNVYAHSKLAGERIVQQLVDQCYIFRAGWMVGGWHIDKKFVYKIIQLCQTEQNIRVVNDTFGSPTFTVDFATNMMAVVESGRHGLYHMGNKGTCSRFEMAKEIVDIMGLQKKVEVCPVSSDEFPLPAPRPKSEMMDNFKLQMLGLNEMPHWKDSLRLYITSNNIGSD
jgi:dTDP-4-dehydrorhamnose reductase